MSISLREAFPGLNSPSLEERRAILASPAYQAWQAQYRASSRLSIPPGQRITLFTIVAFLTGGFLGLSHGSQNAGFRFRAENAHRLPDSQTGWYLYHKSKNYNMALGGIKEGLKMGTKVGVWVGMFAVLENGWDECRGKKDVANTVLATLSVAGGFSIWNRFPLQTAARTAKLGLAVGLLYGFAQDAVGAMKGRRPGYVDFFMGEKKSKSSGEKALV